MAKASKNQSKNINMYRPSPFSIQIGKRAIDAFPSLILHGGDSVDIAFGYKSVLDLCYFTNIIIMFVGFRKKDFNGIFL